MSGALPTEGRSSGDYRSRQADEGGLFAILVHGVSFSFGDSGGLVTRPDTPPFSNHHHPVSRIASEADANNAEEIWLCPRQTGHE
jgi:hypothetical protein